MTRREYSVNTGFTAGIVQWRTSMTSAAKKKPDGTTHSEYKICCHQAIIVRPSLFSVAKPLLSRL